jgi:hypothetical protein
LAVLGHGPQAVLCERFLSQGEHDGQRRGYLYRAKDETLLWSGETDSVYSKDFAKLGKTYASALVKQLKKDKII